MADEAPLHFKSDALFFRERPIHGVLRKKSLIAHPHRAGRFIQQPSGYRAFVPAPLPPDPPLAVGGELQTLLSTADRDIGRLDALAALLPNPDLFVAMYVRHEAVLSSQIEGTQSTLEDMLAFVAEYKGEHLRNVPREIEKGQVGRLWAERSAGRARFAMLFELERGMSVVQQIDEALA